MRTDKEHKKLDPALKSSAIEDFERLLSAKLIGQPEAVEKITRAYQLFVAGLNAPNRPIASLLFAGPTGLGKTHAVESTAEILFGKPQAITKIDCAEYQHSHEISRLLGSPPGYIGHRETNPALSQDRIDAFQVPTVKLSLILFDEIEKANDALWQLMLGILDKATITLGDTRVTDFSKSIIVMTTNLGARQMDKLITGRDIGFVHHESDPAALDSEAMKAIRQKFSPEFMNRIDSIVVFNQLQREHFEKILNLELDNLQDRVYKTPYPFVLKYTPAARNLLIEQGIDPKSGARELKRVIERTITIPVANLITTNQIENDTVVLVDAKNGGITFSAD